MCLNQARYGISWGAIGAAMACYDTALQYAKQRKQFGNKPIAGHQMVQEKLVWMISRNHQGAISGACKRAAEGSRPRASFTKFLAEAQQRVDGARNARMAREILGANGISEDYCDHAPHDEP
jgi:glutaryl-CoA dehydrogenase